MLWRAVIVGCGRIAGIKDRPCPQGTVRTHAQAYHRHPAFTLTAACDSSPDRLAAFQRRWRIPRGYATLEELVAAADDIDVVSLCSPTAEHYGQLTTLLRQTAPPQVIFVEKPVCERPQELEELERLAHESGVVVLVNHTRRFDPGHQRLAQLIKSRVLGGLVRGRCDYYGGWLHNGSHLVDTLRMLLGVEPSVTRVAPGALGKLGDPCWNVQLLCGNAPVDLEGFDERYYQLFEIDLRFERGRALLQNFGAEITVEQMKVNDIGEKVLAPLAGSPRAGLQSPLHHAVEAIAAHLQGGPPLAESGATLDQARETMIILWQVAQMEQRERECSHIAN